MAAFHVDVVCSDFFTSLYMDILKVSAMRKLQTI
jgi:hypothetical protein